MPEADAGAGAAAFRLSGVSLDRPGVGRVLHDIDLTIPAGRITAVVGPSGSGKTALLRLLNRLEEPSAGEIQCFGRPLADYPVRELRCRVGFVFQTPVLFPGTVADNLRVAAELAGVAPETHDRAFRDALVAAELDPGYLDRAGDRLSGGERQRVTIARALVASPDALLLDEPTSALDAATADRLVETVRRMSGDRRLTVIMVTHRQEEAARCSHEVVMLDGGRIEAAGPTREVLAGS